MLIAKQEFFYTASVKNGSTSKHLHTLLLNAVAPGVKCESMQWF